MTTTNLAELEARARRKIAAHWQRCEKANLGRTSENCDQVLSAFDTYFRQMEKLIGVKDKVALREPLRSIYARLGEINAANGDVLLETDERELLVPFIVDAVAVAGFDLNEFPDREPGGEFRDF